MMLDIHLDYSDANELAVFRIAKYALVALSDKFFEDGHPCHNIASIVVPRCMNVTVSM